MTARRPFILADADLAADRLASPVTDALRLSAVCIALAIASTLIGVGLFFAALPQEPTSILIHYLPAEQGGRS